MLPNLHPTTVRSLLLSGRALDYAVAEMCGIPVYIGRDLSLERMDREDDDPQRFWEPAADAAFIDKMVTDEGYEVRTEGNRSWCCTDSSRGGRNVVSFGYSPSEAVLRCYVADMAGDTFTLPRAFLDQGYAA